VNVSQSPLKVKKAAISYSDKVQVKFKKMREISKELLVPSKETVTLSNNLRSTKWHLVSHTTQQSPLAEEAMLMLTTSYASHPSPPFERTHKNKSNISKVSKTQSRGFGSSLERLIIDSTQDMNSSRIQFKPNPQRPSRPHTLVKSPDVPEQPTVKQDSNLTALITNLSKASKKKSPQPDYSGWGDDSTRNGKPILQKAPPLKQMQATGYQRRNNQSKMHTQALLEESMAADLQRGWKEEEELRIKIERKKNSNKGGIAGYMRPTATISKR
jgi:hypothetical protein